MYAGQTLAQLSLAQLTDPAGVQAELSARVARGGKSAKNALKALERMTAGASVAFPPKAPKADTSPATAPARFRTANRDKSILAAQPVPIGTSVRTATRTANGFSEAERAVIARANTLVRSHGHSVPNTYRALASGRQLKVRPARTA